MEELRILFEYANGKKEKMKELSKEYTDMGFLSKAFPYFTSLMESDKHAILEQIRNYQEFYEEMLFFS